MAIARGPAESSGRAGFCSAPWTDCIAYADGSLKACDRNPTSFGDWRREGLEAVWGGEPLGNFRRAIASGSYPDRHCESCHNNGTQRTAFSSLVGAYMEHREKVFARVGHEVREIKDFHELLFLRTGDESSERDIREYFSRLEILAAQFSGDQEMEMSFAKLRVLGTALRDYLAGAAQPSIVGTFRQAQLQAKCTARCVMCVGKYTGEIVNGPTMPPEHVDAALARPEHVTDFWCNGAEFLNYRDWRDVALRLYRNGTKLRISTNGILLSRSAVEFMVDHRLLAFLTVSLDSATRETLEAVRVNVRFDDVREKLRYAFAYATQKDFFFDFVGAFVMMRRNLPELPAFVRMLRELAGPEAKPRITALCQPLENAEIEAYRAFLHQEHHSLLGEEKLREIFLETAVAQRETGIQVRFYNQTLDEFIAAGMPFPRYFATDLDRRMVAAGARPPAGVREEIVRGYPELAKLF